MLIGSQSPCTGDGFLPLGQHLEAKGEGFEGFRCCAEGDFDQLSEKPERQLVAVVSMEWMTGLSTGQNAPPSGLTEIGEKAHRGSNDRVKRGKVRPLLMVDGCIVAANRVGS